MLGLGHGAVLVLWSWAQSCFLLPPEPPGQSLFPEEHSVALQEKLQKIFDRKPWRIWWGPTCFFYMLIDIITASRRVGDVIMCNKVDLKIKKASQYFIWNVQISYCWKMVTFSSTPPLRGVRENSKTLSCYNTSRVVPSSHWQCLWIVSTWQRGKKRLGTRTQLL